MPSQNMTPFTTAALVQVVPNLKRSQKFLLDHFFPHIVESQTEEVDIDVDVGKRRLAPFCSPKVEGKLVESRTYQTNRFKPAYIKDKRAPDLMKPVRRQIGERIGGGDLTPQQRQAVNIAFEMEDQVDMVDRRLEWMAAQALTTGTVTVKGEGFPETVINYGRAPSLTLTLAGAAKWGQPGVSPSSDIEKWAHEMLKQSGGVGTDLVFTATSWTHFKNDETVKTTIWYPGNGGSGNTINVGAQIERGAVYKGRWGNYDLWVYNDWYVDPTDEVEKPMVVDGTVIMSGADLMGTRAFGLIVDPAFNYGPLAYAPKMWLNQDPAQLYLMMQSAPLVIPSRVNASFSARVCDPVLG
ncbi:major capsid protein [Acinetobacter higginsii]|uniref:major capsid protein n=1 Tax=Acinetobacter higginsii TaxID=70347 RepID=UPI001F4B254A|nr:major capsid protein [Acinetobacter higginsii]MCH7381377.1 major capsid protein [Acinetobacter higginsii]